jgi:cobalt/nickel transport protein
MKLARLFALALCFCLSGAAFAQAHFGMIIPSESTVMDAKNAAITLQLKFWHPFENMGMNLEKPASFQVFHDGKSTDLLPSLKESTEQGLRTWTGAFSINRPGLYAFAMEPKPYFEKEEDCFIIHYTKVYVDAFGDDDGWSEPLGLKTEIVPLIRPGALYAGNVFLGRVLVDGKPQPGAEVEVEWYPGPDKKGVAPYASMVTQTVKADDAGIFAYAAPREGWWGFAALQTAEEKMSFEGKEKDVELGAVLWVRFQAMLPAEKLKK